MYYGFYVEHVWLVIKEAGTMAISSPHWLAQAPGAGRVAVSDQTSWRLCTKTLYRPPPASQLSVLPPGPCTPASYIDPFVLLILCSRHFQISYHRPDRHYSKHFANTHSFDSHSCYYSHFTYEPTELILDYVFLCGCCLLLPYHVSEFILLNYPLI